MYVITFVHNWNHKLDCDAFTTFRMRDDYWIKGRRYMVRDREKDYGIYECVDIKEIFLSKITAWHSYLDTGLPVTEFHALMKKWYSRKMDFTKEPLYWMLFVRFYKDEDFVNRVKSELQDKNSSEADNEQATGQMQAL